MAKKTTGTEPWKRKRPGGIKKTTLTAASKATAQGRARAAGREYPNLVDNMLAASEQRHHGRSKRSTVAKKATVARKKAT